MKRQSQEQAEPAAGGARQKTLIAPTPCPSTQHSFLFIYLFRLRWVFLAACGLSLVVASGGYSLAAMHGLLIGVALGVDSVIVAHRLSCPLRGMWESQFLGQGLNLCPLHWQVDS